MSSKIDWWQEWLDRDDNAKEKAEFIKELQFNKTLDEVLDSFYRAHLEGKQ